MKELIELHQRILAQATAPLPEGGFDFSRDEVSEEAESLPDDLQAEIEALRQAINGLMPDDFDYFASFGSATEEPAFHLNYDESFSGSSEDGTFPPEGSLLDQLRLLDWHEQRQIAAEGEVDLALLATLVQRATKTLPSAKLLQRAFPDETRDFIKERRRDPTKIHVMYRVEFDELMELDFASGEACREELPALLGAGADLVAIVAHGRPLPVERIDALAGEAIRTFRHRLFRALDQPAGADKAESDHAGGGDAAGSDRPDEGAGQNELAA